MRAWAPGFGQLNAAGIAKPPLDCMDLLIAQCKHMMCATRSTLQIQGSPGPKVHGNAFFLQLACSGILAVGYTVILRNPFKSIERFDRYVDHSACPTSEFVHGTYTHHTSHITHHTKYTGKYS